MNFKHSAFIENTPEMMEWLEGLGYEISISCKHYLLTYPDISRATTLSKLYGEVVVHRSGVIDCRSNPDLFKAITAMRDDSDYMQWFTDTLKDDWVLSNGKTKYFDERDNTYHKATLEELIEHFKK